MEKHLAEGGQLTACRIVVPQPGIEPTDSAVEDQSLNHLAARKVPA